MLWEPRGSSNQFFPNGGLKEGLPEVVVQARAQRERMSPRERKEGYS